MDPNGDARIEEGRKVSAGQKKESKYMSGVDFVLTADFENGTEPYDYDDDVPSTDTSVNKTSNGKALVYAILIFAAVIIIFFFIYRFLICPVTGLCR